MEHLTNAIKRVESGRLAKAAQGLADHTLTVAVVFQADDEVRAIVKNGDNVPYTAIITGENSLCACKDFLYRSHTVGPCKHIAALALFAIQNPPTRLTPTEKPSAPDQPIKQAGYAEAHSLNPAGDRQLCITCNTLVNLPEPAPKLRKFREHDAA